MGGRRRGLRALAAGEALGRLVLAVARLADIPGFNIDRVAAAAGDDPEVLRLENLDTDLPPPEAAIEATRAAIGADDANSWLPFTGRDDLKEAVAAYVERRGGPRYDARARSSSPAARATRCSTRSSASPIRATRSSHRPDLRGHAQPRAARRRRAAARPAGRRGGEWRLDLDALRAAVTERTRVVFLNNASFPSGWVASDEEWDAIASLCRERDLWLLYWAGFEGVLFDGRPIPHPARSRACATGRSRSARPRWSSG